MQKLNIHIKDSEKLSLQQKKKYEALRNHPILLRFLSNYPKTEEEIFNHIYKIEMMIENEIKAQNSTHVTSETYESLDENFEVIYKKYPHIQQQEYNNRRMKNYILYPIAEEYLQKTIADIAKEEKNEAYRLLCTVLLKKYNEDKKGVFLFGKMGIGKTYIIHALFNYLIDRYNLKCIAIRSNDLIREFRLRKENKEEFQRLMQSFVTVPVLLIDDIGSEIVDEFGRDEVLFTILDERMRHQKITYFTSNHDLESLENHLSDGSFNRKQDDKALRIIERIKTLTIPFRMEGKNRRYSA